MASVSAFNDMMSQFLVELHKTFPEEKGIKKMLTSFDLLKSTNPRLVVDGYMKGVSPYADKISAKDETFLLEEIENIEFLKELDIKRYWTKMSGKVPRVLLGSTFRLCTCLVLPSLLSQRTPFLKLRISPRV
jgi:glycosyltransferase involved in cell wall biosynthesis